MLKKRLEQAKAEEQWEDCGKYTRQIKQIKRWLTKKEELEKSKALALKAEDPGYMEVAELTKQIKALASMIDKAATIESIVHTTSSASIEVAEPKEKKRLEEWRREAEEKKMKRRLEERRRETEEKKMKRQAAAQSKADSTPVVGFSATSS